MATMYLVFFLLLSDLLDKLQTSKDIYASTIFLY